MKYIMTYYCDTCGKTMHGSLESNSSVYAKIMQDIKESILNMDPYYYHVCVGGEPNKARLISIEEIQNEINM